MADLAADALAVLDAAGHDSAHVMGVSMGGMVAQHLALNHRDRVRSLILGCTTAGGARGNPPWRLLAATALRPVVGATRTFPIIAPALYAPSTRRRFPQRVSEDLEIRLADATDVRTTLAQMAAIVAHDTRTRLGRLAGVPVTVIHGIEDALIPVEHGRDLAARIPGARLVLVPNCGHMLTTDAEREVAAIIRRHLASASAARLRADAPHAARG
jgi:pimeloyl-ACP methyl ester carboxylesterase